MTDREAQTMLAVILAKAMGFQPCNHCHRLNHPWRRAAGDWRCYYCFNLIRRFEFNDDVWAQAVGGRVL